MKTIPNMSNLSAVKTPIFTDIATKNNFFLSDRESSQAESASKKDLVVVDSRVENYGQLIGGLKAGTEVFVLNPTRDAIAQITQILAHRSSINSLHIVSHGREAAIEIGSKELNIDNLETYSSQLQQWAKAFGSQANILIYGCNVGAGKSGIKFIQKLSELTGANIAASNNLTGSAALGGDWELEIATGRINAELAFKKEVLEAYTSVLVTLVSETFQGSSVLGPWIYNGGGSPPPPGLTAGTGPGIIPGVVGLPTPDPAGGGALRLTSAGNNQANYVIYNSPISSADGLKVTFDLFAYNGSIGADGVSFFLIDGTTTPTAAGGFGGSLGYAPNNTLNQPGIAGGYLGVGLDEFGNFSNSNEGRVGGTGQLSDSIAIRGSAATTYSFLTNATVPGGIDNVSATTRTTAKRRVQITLFPGTNRRLSVALDDNGNGVFDTNETFIDIPDLVTRNGAIPATFKFGFASSTGSFTNTHEIANLLVETIITPVTQADISVAKSGPAFAVTGSNITYTITSTNIGPELGLTGNVNIISNTATDVLIQDQLPANLTFVSAIDSAGNGTYNSLTRTVIWPAIPTLIRGASATRSITATVTGALGTTITNTAFSNSSTYDPNPANNNGTSITSQVPTTVVATTADLVTTKAGSTAATVGSRVTYLISTVNNGPDPATNVTITDSIIPGLTGVSFPNGGTYNAATGIVTFPLVPSLASLASVANTVSFIAPLSGASVRNTASSSSATPDPTPANNNGTAANATVTTTLTPIPNQPPVATPTNLSTPPNSSKLITGLGGSDPDGSIASYAITTLPPVAQGVLFLGDPANGGVAVTAGQVLTPAQLGQIYFSSTGTFTGANFTYSATDNLGAVSPAATATVAASPTTNQPPVATPTNLSTPPNSSKLITGLG
ncbi:DUF4347 domain-containing protein, partial [Microcoleus sp. A006_D1]|uniref:DUF4347 domain-containing protein n=1 Tax=Microcoleus sp. A006_D1 TaxID=3055267 RepID=UPI002FCECA29